MQMTPIADAELVQRSRERDANAFGELVERHQRLVFGVALARCGDAALAEDVAQEAFVTAWRDLDRLRDSDRVGTWVAGIARNLAGSAVRTRMRRATPPDIDMPPVPTPEDAVLEREDRELLARALAEVPDAHRETLVLYYLEGESIARIAELLGISDDLVKQRLSRGRRALREGVANRVETALSRARERPALRAGVIAALAAAGTRKASAGKVIAVMTLKKVVIALGALAVAGSAVWIGTRRSGDSARASSPAPVTAAAPTKSAPYVRRIDPETRQKLVLAIHEAWRHEAPPAPGAVPSVRSSGSTPRPALPDEQPDLDKEYIRSCVRELIPLIAECYEQGLDRNPQLGGKVVVDFTIDGAPDVGGVVSESTIDDKESTLADASVRECIQQTMYSLEISPPEGGGQVHVHYPFTFAPAEAEPPK
jgi:RNA polymerase sigma factor (sigma-70 family)